VTDPVDELFAGHEGVGRTDAVVVRQGGSTLLERYRDGLGPGDVRRSWSMAKSMLHAVVGMLVDEGRLSLEAPAPVPEWSDPEDPRHRITLRHMLEMRSGLEWIEAPEPGGRSDVFDMVAGVDGGPQQDTGAYAASKPLVAAPGTRLYYSSGDSAVLSRIVGDLVGRHDDYRDNLERRLFGPLGMTSTRPRFDPAGNWMASSFADSTAQDFARFGQLYLDDGVTPDGRRLLSTDWVASAAHPTGTDDEDRVHTRHWWRFTRTDGGPDVGAYFASGWMGQYVVIVPVADLVVVRLGRTTVERGSVEALLWQLIDRHLN
jgi:CubicO group peptidase (beta-lactamase class C family)